MVRVVEGTLVRGTSVHASVGRVSEDVAGRANDADSCASIVVTHVRADEFRLRRQVVVAPDDDAPARGVDARLHRCRDAAVHIADNNAKWQQIEVFVEHCLAGGVWPVEDNNHFPSAGKVLVGEALQEPGEPVCASI